MDFTCGKCNEELEKTLQLLLSGCPNCGSKVFTTTTQSPPLKEDITKTQEMEDTPETKEGQKESKSIPLGMPRVKREELEDYSTRSYQIIPKLIKEHSTEEGREEEDSLPAIKLKQRGIYEVNIDSLFKGEKSDPIILSGKQGVYRIEILPRNKKKKKAPL